jgi:hypothetical protein
MRGEEDGPEDFELEDYWNGSIDTATSLQVCRFQIRSSTASCRTNAYNMMLSDACPSIIHLRHHHAAHLRPKRYNRGVERRHLVHGTGRIQ